MKILKLTLFFVFLLGSVNAEILNTNNKYLREEERTISPENTSYYIDPKKGSDNNTGTDKLHPWKGWGNLNKLILSKGNRIEVLDEGSFNESLFIVANGTKESPVVIEFSGGKHDFFTDRMYSTKFNISNTNDAPNELKNVAIYLLNSNNVIINGNNSEIVFRGKVIETCISNCSDILIKNISYDYFRPTISEFTVVSVSKGSVVVDIHKDSKYIIEGGKLTWLGEGWQHKVQRYWQEYNPIDETVKRKNINVGGLSYKELAVNKVQIDFIFNPGFIKGFTYQNRNTHRDYAAVFTDKSKNISWNNVNVYFMHGMGFVSQFCENISFDNLNVAPKEKSGRTCAAWADILHFSGCKGDISISNSYLSSANDDAVNVHGTHLRIIDKVSDNQIKVRFMHNQSFGFQPFYKGDEIEFINSKSLLPYSKNVVYKISKLNETDFILTLQEKITSHIGEKDVIENTTWTPNVTIKNNKISYIPTRGLLVSTRGKVVIESNNIKSWMSAILVADDANGWYESGYVTDMIIKMNKFINCGNPTINIHPENRIRRGMVHNNIKVVNNEFYIKNGIVLSAKSTGNIELSNNMIFTSTSKNIKDLVKFKSCRNKKIHNNTILK